MTETDTEHAIETIDQLKQVAWAKAIEKLQGLCKKIFQLHIEERQKLKDIWLALGFNTYQSLVQANYRCKKKLTQLVLDEFETLLHFKEKDHD